VPDPILTYSEKDRLSWGFLKVNDVVWAKHPDYVDAVWFPATVYSLEKRYWGSRVGDDNDDWDWFEDDFVDIAYYDIDEDIEIVVKPLTSNPKFQPTFGDLFVMKGVNIVPYDLPDPRQLELFPELAIERNNL